MSFLMKKKEIFGLKFGMYNSSFLCDIPLDMAFDCLGISACRKRITNAAYPSGIRCMHTRQEREHHLVFWRWIAGCSSYWLWWAQESFYTVLQMTQDELVQFRHCSFPHTSLISREFVRKLVLFKENILKCAPIGKHVTWFSTFPSAAGRSYWFSFALVPALAFIFTSKA